MSNYVISSLASQNNYYTSIKTEKHTFAADEPESLGGSDSAQTPVQLAFGALGSCIAITLKMYYDHKGISWDQIDVHISSEVKKVSEDDVSEEERPFIDRGKIRYIYKDIHIKSDMDDESFKRASAISSKCPVSKMMDKNAVMKTKLHRV